MSQTSIWYYIECDSKRIKLFKEPGKEDIYLSLSDISLSGEKSPKKYIEHWLNRIDTINYLGLWELHNNPTFSSENYTSIKNLMSAKTFKLTISKWTKSVNALGFKIKSGCYGGIYAHSEIALEFTSTLSLEYKYKIATQLQQKNLYPF